MPIIIAFVLSVVVEFLVFLPFFRKKGVKKKSLLWVSAAMNFASYLVLLLLYSFVR